MALYDQSKPGHSTGNPCSEEYETETLVGSGDDADCRTVQRRYAKFPPKVISCEKLGYIQDANGVGYSRDVGRSSVVNNRVFYQFGDTFCKNDHGDFVGIVSHTCARVVLPTHPLHTEYYKIEPSGLVQCFIPLTEREKEFDRQGTAQGTRTTLWSFGGIAEDGPGADKGWCWFEKGSAYKDGSLQRHGTGIARVYFDEDHGRLAARRPKEGPLFVNDEPSFGTFSTLLEDGWVYLWGTRAGEIFLARVRPLYALRRETYEYWNGYGYVADCGAAKPVLKDMQQGAIYRTKLFHWKLGYTHAFIGVNRFGDSKVMMGLATRLEGPYEMFPIADATGINERGGYMYCMYPHPWAFKEEDGELMVTWSEHWPGGVIGAKLKFDMGPECTDYQERFYMHHLPHAVTSYLPGSEEVRDVMANTETLITHHGRYVAQDLDHNPQDWPLHLRIVGLDAQMVKEAHWMLGRIATRLISEEEERIAQAAAAEAARVEVEQRERTAEAQEAALLADLLIERPSRRRRRVSSVVRRFFNRR